MSNRETNDLNDSSHSAQASTLASGLDPQRELLLRAPLPGVLVPLEDVPDPVFAQKIVGIGVAIDPTGQEAVAPCDGRISQIHPSGHAVAITTREGVEILIHIGLDTVKLRGEGFTPLVKMDREVRQGEPLIRFDADVVAQKAKSLLTVVVITNPDRIDDLRVTALATVGPGEPLIRLRLRGPATAQASAGATASPAQALVVKSERLKICVASGIHARPAALLASIAKRYQAEVTIRKGGRGANVRSVVGVMSLEVGHGDEVCLEAKGSDAREAVGALTAEILRGFGEELTDAPAPARPATGGEAPVRCNAPGNLQKGIFPGVIASPGQAIGAIFQMRARDVPVTEKGESPTRERERLKHALEEAGRQLTVLVSRLQQEGDSEKALIFVAHQELLEDPGLNDEAQDLIVNHGKSAAFAWKKSYTDASRKLAALNNQLLAARANDVRDVGGRVLQLLHGGDGAPAPTTGLPDQCILVAEDLTPSDVATLDRSRVLGLVTTTGGATSHVAILARSLDIPALAGVDPSVLEVESGTVAALDTSGTVDSTHGVLRLRPSEKDVARFRSGAEEQETRRKEEHSHALEPAMTVDGHRIEVVGNLKGVSEAEGALQLGAEGVGLLRTEFLFMSRDEAPNEEEQLEAYGAIARIFGQGGKKRPLIIRTLDVGGDKPLRYLPLPKEDNPFLGERGIRVSLARPGMFRVQLRAILRASELGDVRVMFPMIAAIDEVRQARAILEEERKKLGVAPIQAGIMIEVPSAAILAEHLAREADFFSVGSNDLSQYTLAIDRGHPRLASQVDGLDPSLLRLIDLAARAARSHGRWIGVCGGIASDAQAVPVLVGLGVDELSASIPSIPAIKAQIRRLSRASCEELARKALEAESGAEVRRLVREHMAVEPGLSPGSRTVETELRSGSRTVETELRSGSRTVETELRSGSRTTDGGQRNG